MAKLINGNGNQAVYAAEDSDYYASVVGNQTCISGVGSQMAATAQDANTIGVADGVCITKEGRRIQLDAGLTDIFTIPTGESGVTNYYIIGYKLTTAADSSQTCETFVQKMNSSSETIQEDTFRGGATDVYVSLYRVTQDGFNIDTIEPLLPTLEGLSQLNASLTANSNKYQASYQDSKYGFTIDGNFYQLGGNMECVKYGVLEFTGASETKTVSLSGLGITSANDYMVILDGKLNRANSYTGVSPYISAKSSSSFTVTGYGMNLSDSHGFVSYQVIKLK